MLLWIALRAEAWTSWSVASCGSGRLIAFALRHGVAASVFQLCLFCVGSWGMIDGDGRGISSWEVALW